MELERAHETTYGTAFFAGIDSGSRQSAEIVVPLIIELFSPRNVVDFGAGAGHWAATCLARGVGDVLAVDGPWVPPEARAVPADRFLELDLAAALTLDRRFDLAICLEAAEHLPSASAAELVRTLTTAAPVVVFSAAVPGQGGDGHINERPASYWANVFASRGYACFDDLRRRVWNDALVEVWYRQNLLCFVRQSELATFGARLTSPIAPDDPMLDVIHPELLLRRRQMADGLESYARRLEGEKERLRLSLEETRGLLEQRQAELDRIKSSLPWRALRAAADPIRRLRR
jgi:hypothetical protein